MFGANKPFTFGTPTTSTGSVFGTSTFNTTTSGSGGLFGSTQQQPAASTGLFGQTSTSTAAPTFGTSFGTQSTGGAMFGQPAPTNNTQLGTTGNSMFGTANQPVFGASAQPSFGAANNQSAFGAKPLAFGASKPLFGTGTQPSFGSTPQPTAFGASSAPTFGTQSSGTLFGTSGTNAPSNQTMFAGGASTNPAQPANGSAIARFQPPMSTDTVMKNNQQQQVNVRHQHISAMREYETKSAEELRFEDYAANRKGPQPGAAPTAGLFGTPSAAPASTGLFGSSAPQAASTGLFGATQNNTAAGSSSLFGKPATGLFGNTTATSSTTGLFGSTPQPAAGTNLFGQPTVQTQPTNSLFGNQPAAQTQPTNSLFGQPAVQNQPTTSLFGQTPAQTQPSLFGQSNTQAQPAGSLFGTTQTASGSLFGTPASQPTTSLFGAPSNTTAPTGGLFGQPATSTQPTTSLFGSTAQPNAQQNSTPFGGSSVFGSAKPLFGPAQTQPTTTTTGGLFGSTPAQTQPASGNLFGTPQQPAVSASGSLFGSAQPQPSAAGSLFGAAQPTQSTATASQPFGAATNTTPNQPGFGNLFVNKPQTGAFGAPLLSTPQSTATTNSLFGKPLSTFGNTPQQSAGSLFGAAQPATSAFTFSSNTQPASNSSLFGASNTTQSNVAGTLFGASQPLPQTSLFNTQNNSFGNQPQTNSLFGAQPAAAPAAASDAVVAQLQTQNNLLQQMVVALSAQAPYGNNSVLSSLVERSRTGEAPPQRPTVDLAKQPPLTTAEQDKTAALLQSLIQDDRRTLLSRPTSFLAQRNTLSTLFNRTPQPAYGGLLRSVSAQLSAPPTGKLFAEPISSVRSFADRHQEQSASSRSFAGRATGGWLDELDTPAGSNSTRFATRRQLKQLVIRPPAPSLSATTWNLRSPMPSSRTPLRREEEDEEEDEDEQYYRSQRSDQTQVLRRRSDGEQLRRAEDRRSGPPDLDAGSHTGPSPFRTPERPIAKSSAVPKRLTFDSPEVESPSAMSPSSPSSAPSPVPAAADNDRSKQDAVTPKRERDTRDDSLSSRRGDQDGVVSSSQLHPARIVLTNPEYYTRPSLAELARRTDENGDCFVNELVVGRTGYGEVHFAHRDAVAQAKSSKGKSDSRPTSPAPNAGPRPGWFNIACVNLDETVVIERKAVTVYPNDDEKPPIGEGLNRPARVTLLGIFPRDKVTREPIRDAARIERLRYGERIAAATQEIGAHFVRYAPTDGAWTFDVAHFSKYGLAPDDDDDDATTVASGSLPAKGAATTAKPADTSNKLASRLDQPANESAREHKVDKQVLRLEGSTVAVRDGDDVIATPSMASVPAVAASSAKASASANLSLALLSSQRAHASTTQTPLVAHFRRSTAAGRSFLDLDAVDDRRAQATRVADLERDAVLLLNELDQTPHRLARPAPEDLKLTKTAPPVATEKGDKKLLNLEQLEAAASIMTGARFDNVTRLFAPFPGLSSSLLDGLSRHRCWHAALRSNGPAGDRVLPVARRFRVRFGPRWTVVLPARPEQLPVSNVTRKRPFVNGLAVGRLHTAITDDSARFVAQCEALLNVALNACVLERDAHCGAPFARPNSSALDDMLSAYSRLLEADVDSDVQQETDAESLTCLFDSESVREVRAALRLFSSLFGSVPADLVSYNRNFPSQPNGRAEASEYTESQTRKELVTRWLETELRLHSSNKRLNETAETRTKQNAHIGAVFERLVEHRVDEAATICADAGDLRLALLIAQVGRNGAAPRRVRELIDEQLAVWTVELSGCTRFIDPARLKLFHLLAGRMISVGYSPTATANDTKMKMNTSTTLLSTSSVNVNVCDTLDWLQAFGMHLWYANVPSANLEHVLRTFDRAWKPLLGARGAAYCKPPTKRIRNEVSKMRTVKSVCYHLLKLYAKRSHHLEKLLMPEAMLPGTDCTPAFSSLCDARFSWLLWQLLQSAGFTHLPVAAQIRLHTSLAAQLESVGMWDWAAFVLSHVPHSASRQFAIRALLLRNVSISRVEMQLELDRSTAQIDDSTDIAKEKPSFTQHELDAFAAQKERESFLCDRIGVAREWLDEAKAARARSERAFELAAFYALRHADFAAAHRTLLDDLLPDLLLTDQYDRIDTLLDYFEHVFTTNIARRNPLDVGSSSLLGEQPSLPDWYTNGARVYRDLVQLVRSASSTVEQLRTAARDGDLAELVRFVNDLQQRVVSLCVRLRTFRTGNKQQTLAKVEFVRVLNTQLNTVRRKLLPTVPLCERGFAVLATDGDETTRIDSSLLDFSAAKYELLELCGPLAIVELDC